MKNKRPETLEPQLQIQPVVSETTRSSLEQLSLEQLFDLFKIIIEIEEFEAEGTLH